MTHEIPQSLQIAWVTMWATPQGWGLTSSNRMLAPSLLLQRLGTFYCKHYTPRTHFALRIQLGNGTFELIKRTLWLWTCPDSIDSL